MADEPILFMDDAPHRLQRSNIARYVVTEEGERYAILHEILRLPGHP